MPSSSELIQSSTPSFLIIGDGGTEKTRFAVQAPNSFVYDHDGGLISTRDLPSYNFQTFKDAPHGSKSTSAARGIYEWGKAWPAFIEHLNKQWDQIEAGTWPFETLVIDSLTTLTAICMNYVLKGTGKKPTDPITLPEWGSQLRLMESVMEQLAAWPVRLVVTAHIKRDTNETMATIEYLPMITGQLAGRIGIYFDEVYYTESKGKGKDRKVTFITEATGLYKQAKSRHNVPNGVENSWKLIHPYFGIDPVKLTSDSKTL